jgi:hypothetical protein
MHQQDQDKDHPIRIKEGVGGWTTYRKVLDQSWQYQIEIERKRSQRKE